jgi:hypothetical protein
MRGCENDVTGVWFIRGKEIANRCPVTLITQGTQEIIRAYNFYKNGILPYAGGWLMQTRRFAEAMQILDSETNSISQKEIEKARKQVRK